MLTPLYAGTLHDYYGQGIHLKLDHLRTTTHGLESWVELGWTNASPEPRVLTYGTYNLMGARTVSTILSQIPDEYRKVAAWEPEVKGAIYNTIKVTNEGDPIELLTPAPMDGGRWMVRPLVATTGATGLIGPGGTLKSFLALALASAVATNDPEWVGWKPQRHGPVLYLDWEADRETHAERLYAFGSAPSHLFYRQERRPLHRSVESLVKQVALEGICLAVVDSVMLARGQSGEGSYENSTVLFYAALRELGIPTLLVDHKSKEAMKDGRKGAYGSIVNDNSRRLSWEVTGVVVDGNIRIIRLEQGKSNNVGRLEPVAMRVEIQGNENDGLRSLRVRRVDSSTLSPINLKPDALPARVLDALTQADEALTVGDLSEILDASPASLRVTLNRLTGVVNLSAPRDGSEGRWTLAYRATELPSPF